MPRDYSTIPLEINEHTDLDDFDEYEAHERNWPDELIRAALHEIDRRECWEEVKNYCFDCGSPLDEAGFCWNLNCH